MVKKQCVQPQLSRQSTMNELVEMTREESSLDILCYDDDDDDDDESYNADDESYDDESYAYDDDDERSIDSLSTVEDLTVEDPLLAAVEDVVTAGGAVQEPHIIVETSNDVHKKELDVAKYMAWREMSPFQERMNAITILPNPIYCLYFILAGHWMIQQQSQNTTTIEDDGSTTAMVHTNFDESNCIQSDWFPHFHAMPPPTVMAVFVGITLHAPFSFLYHYKYAHALEGTRRTAHWSRRLDHSAIHVCSAFLAYATSGSWDYTMANILFNADCIYRQFIPKVRPRRNQIRVFISMVAYTIPILNRGDFLLFSRVWFTLLLGSYFFIAYPVKGWSHSVFHLVICFLPPLLMQAASTLPSSQPYLATAAQCAVYRNAAVVSAV